MKFIQNEFSGNEWSLSLSALTFCEKDLTLINHESVQLAFQFR